MAGSNIYVLVYHIPSSTISIQYVLVEIEIKHSTMSIKNNLSPGSLIFYYDQIRGKQLLSYILNPNDQTKEFNLTLTNPMMTSVVR